MSCVTSDGEGHVAVTFRDRCWPLCDVSREVDELGARPRGWHRTGKFPAREGAPAIQRVTCAACASAESTDLEIAVEATNTRVAIGAAPLTILRWERTNKLSFTPLRNPSSGRRFYTARQVEEMRELAKKNGATGERKKDRDYRLACACMLRLGLAENELNSARTVTLRGVTHSVFVRPRIGEPYSTVSPWGGYSACERYFRLSEGVTAIGVGEAALRGVDCAECLARDRR